MKLDRLVDISESAAEQHLLRAAKSEQLSVEGRQRILGSFGLTSAGPQPNADPVDAAPQSAPPAQVAAQGGAAAGAKLSILHAISVKWIGLCALGLAPAVVVIARGVGKTSMPGVATPAPSDGARPWSSPVVEPPQVTADAVGTASPDATSAVAVHRPLPSSLSQEVAVLRGARGALDHHDAAAAVKALDRYRRTFPEPQLAPEAMALRVEALATLGELGPARALADRFDAVYPQSPYRARLRSLVAAPRR